MALVVDGSIISAVCDADELVVFDRLAWGEKSSKLFGRSSSEFLELAAVNISFALRLLQHCATAKGWFLWVWACRCMQNAEVLRAACRATLG